LRDFGILSGTVHQQYARKSPISSRRVPWASKGHAGVIIIKREQSAAVKKPIAK